MSNLTSCLSKAGTAISRASKTELMRLAREQRGVGLGRAEAEIAAVRARLAAVQAELATLEPGDLFPEEFADKNYTVSTSRLISSRGDTEPGGNVASDGRVISSTKQGLENFWRWFGNSAVVDDKNRPLVVYHGTGADVARFETMRETKNTGLFGSEYSARRAGVFFTDDKNVANAFAERGGGNIIPAYLKIENAVDLRKGLGESLERELEAGGYNSRMTRSVQYDWELFDEEYDGPGLVAALRKAGYDGAIINDRSPDEEQRTFTSYVVFDSAQIKSAIGNRGTFNSNDPDIRYSPARWTVAAPTKGDDAIRYLQDKQIDLKRVVAAVKEAVGNIGEKWNAYLQEELYHGRTAKKTADFLDFELRPLLQQMQAAGVTIEELETYLHNRHARERNEQIAKINEQMPDGGSGIKTADAEAYLAGLDPALRRKYETLAARVDAINANTERLLVTSGLEKPETIAAWKTAYKHYVPLQREEFEDESSGGTGQGMSVRGSASKRAIGSDKPVANILANIAAARERTIVRAEKNRVATALYGMVLQAPNKGFWLAFAPDRVKNQEKIEQELIDLGLAPPDAAQVLAEPKQQFVDPRSGRVVTRVNPLLRSQPNVLALRVNGEDRFVMFSDKDERATRTVRALKNLDADQLGRVLGALGKVSRYFANVNTQWNPIFGVVNLLRDTQGAVVNLTTTPIADRKTEVLKNTGSALLGIYKDVRAHRKGRVPQSPWAQLWEEFQKVGGQTGFRDMYANPKERSEALEAEFKKITEGKLKQTGRATLDWLGDYNTAMENAVRLAAYKAAKDKGIDNERAASIAKNLTVNFNRKGDVALQAGALYAFFNASVQGSARMAETLRGPAGKKIIAGGLLLGVLQAFALSAAGYDEEEPPEFVRDRNLLLPTGDGKYVSVPMPLGLHVLPSTARRVTEWMMSGGRDTGKRLAGMLGLWADAFNPIGNAGLSMQTLSPTALDPLAALAENRDWTGKPIAREDVSSLNPTPGFTRAKDVASEWSKGLSYLLNRLSGGTEYKPGAFSPTPDQLDYLIGQLGGGIAREISKGSALLKSATTGEELPAYKVPLLGRFYGETTGQASEAAKFYSNLRKLNEHQLEIEGRRKNGEGASVAAYLRENPDAVLYKAGDQIQRQVAEAKKLKKRLVEQNAPVERVRAIEDRITTLMRQLNTQVEKRRERALE